MKTNSAETLGPIQSYLRTTGIRSPPFPSFCQEFHPVAFLSMNKTPAFSDTSNAVFHLSVYWHIFKVSAYYKKSTYFYCLLVRLVAGSLECNRRRGGKPHIIPCYQTSDVQERYKMWAEHIISIYPTNYYLFMCVYEVHSKLLKLHKIQPTYKQQLTGLGHNGSSSFFLCLSDIFIWFENNFRFVFNFGIKTLFWVNCEYIRSRIFRKKIDKYNKSCFLYTIFCYSQENSPIINYWKQYTVHKIGSIYCNIYIYFSLCNNRSLKKYHKNTLFYIIFHICMFYFY